MAQTVKCLSTMRETQIRSLGWEDPLEKEMASHSRTIAWKIPWTEEPGGLQVHGASESRRDTAERAEQQQRQKPLSGALSCKWAERPEAIFHKGVQSESEVTQSCPTLCNPMDCSLPGSSVRGIFQAIVLEWLAISFSRGSSQPRDRIWVSRIVDRRFTV